MVVRRVTDCICRSWLEGEEAGGGDSLLEGGGEVEDGCDGSLVLGDE